MLLVKRAARAEAGRQVSWEPVPLVAWTRVIAVDGVDTCSLIHPKTLSFRNRSICLKHLIKKIIISS